MMGLVERLLRIAMIGSNMIGKWQRRGKCRIRLDLTNGMRLEPLTHVTDESRTMLSGGLATRHQSTPCARTNGVSVILALPLPL
jgi:hypothetical protein